MASLASFKHTLQPEITLSNRTWSYTVPNLPSPNELDTARLIKTITLSLNKSPAITLSLLPSSPNRAIASSPLHTFLILSLADLRAPPRGTEPPPNTTTPSTPRECTNYAISLLRSGITLNGTHYNFFGHSNSQLKSRTCFMHAGSKEHISRMIESLGDFSKIKAPGKKAKRIGLLFATAAMLMNISPDRVEDIPDIETDEYVFTDGCGLIAPRLAQELARKKRIVFRDRRYTPSVFQLRYRGYKGVVTVDPTMREDKKVLLRMRKSMKKFSGGGDEGFAVVEYSRPYAYGYLNDEVVILLDSLGVDRAVLHRKQREHFAFLEEATRDAGAAFRFLSWVGMPELAERVLMEDWLEEVQTKTKKLVKAEYGKMLNKRDEQRCRILVPASRLLFGVCDAWGVLKEGECAVKVTMFGDGQPAALKNMEVLVTRNPCLHPGDLQKFRVVERPELAHLVDCIVFSTQGKRPAADLMSGGDLDGDTFFVCWDKDLIPSTIAEPAKYPGVKEPVSFKPVTDDDRLVYFAGYKSSSLGRVKNLYLDWARVKGAMAPECQELNRLFSQCVDGSHIKVPSRLEKTLNVEPNFRPFFLDELHAAATALIEAYTNKVKDHVLEGYEFDAVQLLLNRDQVAMSEFELICMTLRWCRKNNARLENFINFFDFNVLTAEEKAWVLQQMPPTGEIPAMILNAVSYSNLLTQDAARRFQLSHHSIRWKNVYDSLSRDRLGTFLDTASQALATFHRKLIVLQVDERLVVAIYVPKKIEPSQDCVVDDSVRVFAFTTTQGTETQSRVSLPTKMTYRLFCDERNFQLFEGQRGNTWIFITRGASDDSSYRATSNTGDRRRQRQATVDQGVNFDFCVSIALDKFSKGLQRHVGRVNRNGVSAAEIYVISNRDVKSMRNLDLWLDQIDSDTVLPLFDQEPEEYRIASLGDVDWKAVPDFIVEVAHRGNLAALWELTQTNHFVTLFSWLLERNQSSVLFRCYDFLLKWLHTKPKVAESNEAPTENTRQGHLDPSDILSTMLDFLRRAPSLVISLGRTLPFEARGTEASNEILDALATTLEVHAFEILRAYVLSANAATDLIIEPFKEYLSRIGCITVETFIDLMELISLTVQDLDLAMAILLECFGPEAERLLPEEPVLAQYLSRNAITIALDHISEASEPHEPCPDLLWLKLYPKDHDGYQVVETTFRIDSETHLSNAEHVRLTVASIPANAPLSKPVSIDALAIHSESGIARFQCLHPLPPFFSQCQWTLTPISPFTTTKTTFSALRIFVATQPPLAPYILGLSSPPSTPLSHPPFSALNESQNAAITTALSTPLSLIWGPPGTGKTSTIISLLVAFQTLLPESRILVTAPTHNAVDNVLRRYITSSTIPPLRISTEIRKVSDDLKRYTIDAMAGVEVYTNRSTLRQAKRRVKDAKIAFTTCIGSGIGLLRDEEFDIVIVDEASQITEPGGLVPLVKGCSRAVLVGDHVQLRPTVQKSVAEVGGDVSLFERLFLEGRVKRGMLEVQYRMCTAVCQFSSDEFYQGRLKTGVDDEDRKVWKSGFPWPKAGRRLVFVECAGREESVGTSKVNRGQTEVCRRVCGLLGQGVEGKWEVAVLTPYAKHAEELKRMVGGLRSESVTFEVSSIDGFQGRETDVVVFVTTKSNERRNIGFLTDRRRMNVALTRARRGVIIIGNRYTLTGSTDEKSAGLWERLLAPAATVRIEDKGLAPAKVQVAGTRRKT